MPRLWKFAPIALLLLSVSAAERANAQGSTCKDGTTRVRSDGLPQ